MNAQDELLNNLFYHLVSRVKGNISRTSVSDFAGVFSSALKDAGVIVSPHELRVSFFNKMTNIGKEVVFQGSWAIVEDENGDMLRITTKDGGEYEVEKSQVEFI